ncbi:hypothetical protein ABPG75_013477 [Micractinium tetrahymenae]
MPPKEDEPRLGIAPERLALTVCLWAIAAAFLYQNLSDSGMIRLLGSHLRAAPWNPLAPPCGLLQGKEFAVLADRIVTPRGQVLPGAVHVRGGQIASVYTAGPAADRHMAARSLLVTHPKLEVLDYGSAVVAPGLVDVHVHMNEPGRVEWEGMETATRAAAAGGVTTVVDMPLNSAPCTTTPAELARKLAAARQPNHTYVDVGLWAGLVPANARDPTALRALIKAGALGFKAFMAPSGIDDFPHVSPAEVAAALPTIRALGVPLLVHAELVDEDVPQGGNPREHATWLASRPRRFEQNAVRALLDALRTTASSETLPGFKLHIVHLADADLLPELQAAKAEGLPLSVETCPHYLNFAAEEVPTGDTRFKCAPPLREGENRGRLLQGLAQGVIDSVATDHSPSEPSLKLLQEGDFMRAWGGIAGLQYALPATWQPWQAVGLNLTRFVQAWSATPAALAGLGGRKGALRSGYDADLVVWDPEAGADTSPEALQHRHKVSPYAGLALKGRVLATFVRGSQVFGEQRGVAAQACGAALLQRPAKRPVRK